MTWVLAIALALAAFALGAFVFGVARREWTTFAAALALGLAGYALQASPEVPGAPAADAREEAQPDWGFIDARKEMVASGDRSDSREMIVADALARQGQYANAAAMLREERLARLDQIIAGGGAVPPPDAPSP